MPDPSPFTLRMAGHELIGVAATEAIISEQGASWLAVALMAHIEGNDIQGETADLLRSWNDRRTGKSERKI